MTETPKPIESASKFERLTHLWRRKGDRVVVFSDAHFNLKRFEFNQTGARVWEMLDDARTVGEIVDDLQREYPEIPKDTIATAVVSFISDLEQQWLAVSQERLREYE